MKATCPALLVLYASAALPNERLPLTLLHTIMLPPPALRR